MTRCAATHVGGARLIRLNKPIQRTRIMHRVVSRPATWPFNATCPSGHRVVQDAFSREELRLCLASGVMIRMYCVDCDAWWTATDQQRRAIGWALEQAS